MKKRVEHDTLGDVALVSPVNTASGYTNQAFPDYSWKAILHDINHMRFRARQQVAKKGIILWTKF